MIHNFSFQELSLRGAYLIRPFFATDERGSLIKDYSIESYHEAGIDYHLKETFYTYSHKCVIRAIHFQLDKPQPKLMRCISGHVYHVIVDLRPGSSTFGKWLCFNLNGLDPLCLLVPAGFGQGYLALEDSIMSYKAAEVFYGPGDSGIIYDDVELGIKWPFELIGGKEKLIISEKDQNLMSFKDFRKQFA
jgi:dTDP-4-dehydrorhamnose 3,5-epimerase